MSQPYNIGVFMQVAFLRIPRTMRTAKVVEYLSTVFKKEVDDQSKVHYSLKLGITVNDEEYRYEAGGDVDKLTDSTGKSTKAFSLTAKIIQNNKKPTYISHRIRNDRIESFESTMEPLYQSTYMSSSVSLYSSCVKFLSESIVSERKKDILSIIKSFDSNVEDISIVGEDIYLHNTISGTLPLFAYGSGLQKAVLLTALLAYNRGGIVLIDEIDNAINISAFHDIFSWFVSACIQMDIQAFITTHSAEAVDAILESADEFDEDNIRIITLRKDIDQKNTSAIIRTGKSAMQDRLRFEMELRV